jgi:putative membrane protein
MQEVLLSIWAGLPVFMVHSGVSLLILVLGAFIYTKVTRHDEIALIRDGNVAASLSYGGAIVGLALPLAFCLSASVSVWDIVFWGIIALVFQIIAFRLADLFMKGVSKRIEDGEMSAAVMLVSVKFSTAFINAAAISG